MTDASDVQTPGPARITLDVFLIVSKIRPDQSAGFRRWLLSRKLGPQTVEQWRALRAEFDATPVR